MGDRILETVGRIAANDDPAHALTMTREQQIEFVRTAPERMRAAAERALASPEMQAFLRNCSRHGR